MSGAVPDVTRNTILHTLCDSEKLSLALKVLNRQLEKECFPDIMTFMILIESNLLGKCGQAMNETRSKGCKPDAVTYNVLVNGIRKEVNEAIKILNDMPSY